MIVVETYVETQVMYDWTDGVSQWVETYHKVSNTDSNRRAGSARRMARVSGDQAAYSWVRDSEIRWPVGRTGWRSRVTVDSF